MSEEQTEEPQKESEENVGNSLINALFEAAEEDVQEADAVENEQPEELNVYGLSDAIDLSQSEQPPTTQETQEEPQETEPEKISAVDKSLL